ncbi:MAG: LamB/YcsF family protein [Fimbriimonadaceae bacterium]
MKVIDLNADLGEGIAWESELLPLISSANICCAAYAGSPEITRATVESCLALGIRIGAHPGYPDPANFGRSPFQSLNLTLQQLNENLKSQLALIPEATYIKPHGAFYNETSTKNPPTIPPPRGGEGEGHPEITTCLLALLKATKLPFMGLAQNSPHISTAMAAQVPFIREGFIDRRYGPNHRLLPRSNPDAIIHDHQEAIDQALRLATTCDSLCVHGDNPNAPELLAKIRKALEDDGYTIKAK